MFIIIRNDLFFYPPYILFLVTVTWQHFADNLTLFIDSLSQVACNRANFVENHHRFGEKDGLFSCDPWHYFWHSICGRGIKW